MCVLIVPEAPWCHQQPNTGNITAELSWQPPVNSNGNITQYEVCMQTTSHICTCIHIVSSIIHTQKSHGLLQYKSYYVHSQYLQL